MHPPSNEQVMTVVLVQDVAGIGAGMASSQEIEQMGGEGLQDPAGVQPLRRDFAERGEAGSETGRDARGSDVEADADEVDAATALAEDARELTLVEHEVVGPFEEHAVAPGEVEDGAAEGDARVERDLLDGYGGVGLEGEGGGQAAGAGPPGIGAAAAAGGLAGSEDDGGRSELAAGEEQPGVVAGAGEGGEFVEGEWADAAWRRGLIAGGRAGGWAT